MKLTFLVQNQAGLDTRTDPKLENLFSLKNYLDAPLQHKYKH